MLQTIHMLLFTDSIHDILLYRGGCPEEKKKKFIFFVGVAYHCPSSEVFPPLISLLRPTV